MKIYIGSSFSNIALVGAVAHSLENDGHEITEKWWERPYQIEGLGEIQTTDLKKIYDKLTPEEFYAKPETKASFLKDKQGIKKADAFVWVATMDHPRKYNGASVEFGIATGDDMPCAVVGQLEKSVMFWPLVYCEGERELRIWARKTEAYLILKKG